MRRLPDDIFDMFNISNDVWSPKIDIYETVDLLVIKVAVSGLDPKNIELTLSDDNYSLNIKGIRSEDSNDEKINYHQLEIYYGMFERTIDLPHNVLIDRNNIKAKYENGMLIVNIQKIKKDKPISIKID